MDPNNPLSIPSRMECDGQWEPWPHDEEPETVTCAVCPEDITYGVRFTCEDCRTVVCHEHYRNPDDEGGPDTVLCEACMEKWREQRKAA